MRREAPAASTMQSNRLESRHAPCPRRPPGRRVRHRARRRDCLKAPPPNPANACASRGRAAGARGRLRDPVVYGLLVAQGPPHVLEADGHVEELRSHRVLYGVAQSRCDGDHRVLAHAARAIGAVELGHLYRDGLDLLRKVLGRGDLVVGEGGIEQVTLLVVDIALANRGARDPGSCRRPLGPARDPG